ncbi:hypothetical protein EIP86_007749 [Pleurotus ostreatoroseus]|nr:hypothetical protein EIP86_007749 [Pleurotus ostreatoroseus]
MTDVHPDSAPPPSAKAKGKRPASGTPSAGLAAPKREENTPGPSTAAANTPKSGMQTRPKRVLPSRSRRGGPGVGSCDVDVMILETRKRRLESEPLVPGSTKFLLTTNAHLVPAANDGASFDFQLNTQAYSRYFDRPEVQKAYKEQQVIQTPEFSLLPEDAVVGGRFRPRGSDEVRIHAYTPKYKN